MSKRAEKLAELREAVLRSSAALRPLVASIRRKDRVLAEQLLRALTNLAMCLVRAQDWEKRAQRREQLLAALLSASEACTLIRVATDARYCTWLRAKPSYELTASALRGLMELAAPAKGNARLARGVKGRATDSARHRGARSRGQPGSARKPQPGSSASNSLMQSERLR